MKAMNKHVSFLNRTLAFLLTLVMLIGIFPFGAYAVGETENAGSVSVSESNTGFAGSGEVKISYDKTAGRLTFLLPADVVAEIVRTRSLTKEDLLNLLPDGILDAYRAGGIQGVLTCEAVQSVITLQDLIALIPEDILNASLTPETIQGMVRTDKLVGLIPLNDVLDDLVESGVNLNVILNLSALTEEELKTLSERVDFTRLDSEALSGILRIENAISKLAALGVSNEVLKELFGAQLTPADFVNYVRDEAFLRTILSYFDTEAKQNELFQGGVDGAFSALSLENQMRVMAAPEAQRPELLVKCLMEEGKLAGLITSIDPVIRYVPADVLLQKLPLAEMLGELEPAKLVEYFPVAKLIEAFGVQDLVNAVGIMNILNAIPLSDVMQILGTGRLAELVNFEEFFRAVPLSQLLGYVSDMNALLEAVDLEKATDALVTILLNFFYRAKDMTLNGVPVLDEHGSLLLSAFERAFLLSIPTMDDFCNLTSGGVLWSMVLETAFKDSESTTAFGVDIGFYGSDDAIAFLSEKADLLSTYLAYAISGNGDVEFDLTLPARVTELLLRALHSDKLSTGMKQKVLQVLNSDLNTMIDYLAGLSVDELQSFLEEVSDRLGGAVSQYRARIEQVRGYVVRALRKLPASLRSSKVADFYLGSGAFHFEFEEDVQAATVLNKLKGRNSILDALLELFSTNDTLRGKVNADIAFTGVYRLTMVQDGETVFTTFLPAGASLALVTDLYPAYNWLTADQAPATTMPGADTTIYAEENYVIFLDETGLPIEGIAPIYYTKGASELGQPFPAVPQKEGYTASWSLSESELDLSVGGVIEVRAVYERILPVYTITFRDEAGNVVATIPYTEGDPLPLTGLPAVPAKDYYTAVGWYVQNADGTETAVEALTEVTSDLTVLPKYQAKTYTVNFYLNDTDETPYQTLTFTIESGLPTLAVPEKEGHKPGAWYVGDILYSSYQIPADLDSPVKAVAKYEILTYTVTFYDLNGNKVGEPVVFAYGAKEIPASQIPAVPENAAYPKDHGYVGVWNFQNGSLENKNYEVKPVYTGTAEFYFYGNQTPLRIEFKNADEFRAKTPANTAETFYASYRFAEGKMENGVYVIREERVLKDLTVIFVFPDSTTKTVTYHYGDSVTAPTISASQIPAGYTAAWPAFADKLNQEAVVYVNAVKTPIVYKVTFKADGSTVGSVLEYTVESLPTSGALSQYVVPEKAGYTGEWYVGDRKLSEYTFTLGDVTVEAKRTPIVYKVTFKADGSTVGSVLEYTVESLPTSDALSQYVVPEKAGYTGEWYVGDRKLSEYTFTSGDVTVEAKYTEVPQPPVGPTVEWTNNDSGTAVIVTVKPGSDGKPVSELAKDGIDLGEAFKAAAENDLGLIFSVNGVTVDLDKDAVKSIYESGKTAFRAFRVENQADASGDYASAGYTLNDCIYEISFNGASLGTGSATVSIEFSPANAGKVRVCYVNAAGEVENMNATYENGKAVFQTTHFSTYVVDEEPAEPVPGPNYWWVWLIVVVVILAIAAVVVLLILKKKKGNKPEEPDEEEKPVEEELPEEETSEEETSEEETSEEETSEEETSEEETSEEETSEEETPEEETPVEETAEVENSEETAASEESSDGTITELTEEVIKEIAEDLPVAEESVADEVPEHAIYVEDVDAIMADEEAIETIRYVEKAHTGSQAIINVDTLNSHFSNGDLVNLDILKDKKLIPSKSGRVKILARGYINKALNTEADSYSIQAIKMIKLAGGTVTWDVSDTVSFTESVSPEADKPNDSSENSESQN